MSNSEDFIIPPNVQAIFDEGLEGSPFAANVTVDSVQLLRVEDRVIIREVKWAQAAIFTRRFLSNVLEKAVVN